MRLIDADRLLEILKREETYHNDLPQRADGIRDAIMDVISAPTVDAVEVVRCKDCIQLQCNLRPDGTLPKGVDLFECRHWCGSCDSTDFCNRSERKKDGEQHEG